jgi:electron transfer flavoprotein-quinone oxidoreductase
MGHDRYDVIVVGAGLAGSSAALHCAENNLSVALLERGEYPGSKNIFGGTIYSEATSKIIPSFWEEAPLERAITNNSVWFMETSSAVQLGFTGLNYNKPPYNTFSAIRSRFDHWLANKAVEKGAHLMTSTLVEDFVYEKNGLLNKKISGVILEDGSKIYSDIVIIAEGFKAYLTQKAGLRGGISPKLQKLYVKELLYLPAEKIEERFSLTSGEGANIAMIGYPTSGALGKGGIWTNKDTISLVVGCSLQEIIDKGLNPYQLLSRLKEHPLVKRLIEGAETVEYLASSIPKADYTDIPELFDDGVLVTGDAGMLVSGRHGTDIAMLSGRYAAETAILARAKKDFTTETLSNYRRKIENTFFIKDKKSSKGTQDYYQDHPDADFLLSQVLNDIAYEFFAEGLEDKKQKMKEMFEELWYLQPAFKSVADIYQGILNWRVL